VGHVEKPDGLVDNLASKRRSVLFIPEGAYGVAVWVTTKVHAPWTRLALVADDPGLEGDNDGTHLFINAHCGGHAEETQLDANGDLPYVYKFA
jgi:hypothetical protein